MYKVVIKLTFIVLAISLVVLAVVGMKIGTGSGIGTNTGTGYGMLYIIMGAGTYTGTGTGIIGGGFEVYRSQLISDESVTTRTILFSLCNVRIVYFKVY